MFTLKWQSEKLRVHAKVGASRIKVWNKVSYLNNVLAKTYKMRKFVYGLFLYMSHIAIFKNSVLRFLW